MSIILASASPRRKELMTLITPQFTVETAAVDESAISAHDPAALVLALAYAKCMAVAKNHPDDIVIGCDTVVDCGGQVFGKPADAADACRMLQALSGRTHAVHTGVCMAKGERVATFSDTCKVSFFSIRPEDLQAYIATDEPYDKAGAYAIQGHAALWIDRLEGDYYTIMGFPVSRAAHLLEEFNNLL
ncbi:MAG: septum formation protein Maf [Faecalibacterium sp.]|nr:septum formation protein Maf [Faecalibacterium sp.]